MRTFLHVMVVVSCALGALLLLIATFSGAMSAPQQAATAAIVVGWVAIFHVLSSMVDRRG